MTIEESLEIVRSLSPEEKEALLVLLQEIQAPRTDRNIERSCRHRLAKHGMRFHKKDGGYLVYMVDDPEVTKEYTLKALQDFCERLAEKEAD